MKKEIKRMLAVVMVVLCTLITGCGENEMEGNKAEEIHAVLVLQPVETVPVVNLEAAQDMLRSVCSVEESTVEVIIADGKPWKIDVAELEEIDESYSKTMQEQILNENVQTLMTEIKEAVAVHPESDLRGALEKAVRELQSYEGGRKELIIFGSGINTVEPLTMQEMPLAEMDVDAIVGNLINAEYGIELDGISVTMYNLGDTCGNQEKLSNKDKKSLEKFWTLYLEAGNPKSLIFKKNLPSELTYENVPEMSTVPIGKEEDAMESLDKVEAVTFDETSISFKKGTAVLDNPQAAELEIKEVTTYMKENDIEALLVGGTAKWGEQSESLQLSYDRAMAIKELFVGAGIEEERLTVIGTGWLSCFYQNDQFDDGTLNEDIAPQNRACTWIKTTSALAEQVWNDADFSSFIVE